MKGKRFLVTGGCQGIGRGIVIELWRLGANVVALSNQPENLAKLKDQYPSLEVVAVDLTDWDKTRDVIEPLGAFDGLVNCAGVAIIEPFLETKPSTFDQFLDNFKMALTPAEKQKRYRERLKQNKEKYEEAKRKHRQHYHQTKRLAKDLTPKEKRNANTIWKLRQREYRQRKKNLQAVIAETPPTSPTPDVQNIRGPVNPIPGGSPSSNLARERGRRKLKSNRSRLYRENKKMEKKIQLLKKKCDKYRKRLCRGKKKVSESEDENEQVKKKYRLLTSSIRDKYHRTKNMKQKLLLKSILKGDRIEKCRKKNELLNEVIGINRQYTTKVSINNNAILLKRKIHRFFLRDDISRATAGKKETLTRNGNKLQKRFLLDTMKSLHKHFKAENPGVYCSYYYFTKNRPFFVVRPSADGRETCLCKTHINFAYKTQALKKQGIIQSDNACDLIKVTVCDDRSKDCMYNDCKTCKNKSLKYNEEKIKGSIKYSQWIRKEEVYEKDGKKFKTMKNVKEELNDDISHFLKAYEKDVTNFKKHVYNIKVQFHNFRECLDNLQSNECAIVVDFSENYNCKYNEEVQSHHFGGSRKQVSLHTVMVYTHDLEKKYKSHSFCTISSSTCHQPAAIWAHLDPIMQWIRSEYESINTVHFFSDGPSTQYRQKQNFYLLCHKIFDYGFAATTWSFFEAGHGKGPADGIGGFLKRTADRIVANGKDIANCNHFMEHLENASKIKLYLIEEVAIKDIQDKLPKSIPRLVGTMKVHHIFTDSRYYLKYRPLTCFCGSLKRGFCDCHDPQIYAIEQSTQESLVDDSIEPACRDLSSDDDVPLSSLTVLKDIHNTLPSDRTSIYRTIYNSSSDTDDDEMQVPSGAKNICSGDKENYKTSKVLVDRADEQQPSTSNYKGSCSKQVSIGDFLHVAVYSDNLKKKKYSYVCKALTTIEDDGEVKVMFLRVIGKKDAKIFRMDEHDVNYVEYDDIIAILPMPAIVKKGLRVYYKFNDPINVFEK